METTTFAKAATQEQAAKLCAVIGSRTEGKLSIGQIRRIVRLLELKNQYKIDVLSDAREFARLVTLTNNEMKHSWAGKEYYKQEGKVLLGNVQFGEEYSYEYFDNGNSTGEDKRYNHPSFKLNQVAAVMIQGHDFSDYNGDYKDERDYNLVIYIPNEAPFKLDPQIKAIIDAFKL